MFLAIFPLIAQIIENMHIIIYSSAFQFNYTAFKLGMLIKNLECFLEYKNKDLECVLFKKYGCQN